MWRHVRDLPVTQSTLITLGGHRWLLVGEMTQEETLLMFIVSKTKNKRRLCLAAVLPEDCLLVVGGWGKYSVEIGCLQ